jgi:hypothetical protein
MIHHDTKRNANYSTGSISVLGVVLIALDY